MAFRTVQVVSLLVGLLAATAGACVAPDAVPGGGGAGGSGAGSSAGIDFAWAHNYGLDHYMVDNQASSVAPAAKGGALVGGSFVGSLTVGGLEPLPNTTPRDGFVIEHDAAGKPIWAEAFAGDADQLVFGAAATPDGGVVVAGSFRNTLVFDGTDHGEVPVGEDGFVASFDGARKFRWLVRINGSGDQAVHALAVTPAGGIVIAGYFAEKLTIGSVTADGAGGRDFFVAKLDATGKALWATSLGGEPVNLGPGDPTCYLGLAGDEKIHVAGHFTGALSFAANVTASGPRDAFVGTLSAAGKPGWAHGIGLFGQEQRAAGLAVDAAGHVLLAGDLIGEVTFGPGVKLVSKGGAPDAFLASYDTDGALLWARRYGSPASDHAGGVAFDPEGNILFTGRFRSIISFDDGPEPLQNAGATSNNDDLFLAKLTPDAEPLFAQAFGGEDNQVATAIACGPGGEVLLAGTFGGDLDFGGGELDAESGDDVFIARFGK